MTNRPARKRSRPEADQREQLEVPSGASPADPDRADEEFTEPADNELVARDSETQKLTDPKAMRALAHPTRLALLEVLVMQGPLTATEAAAFLDDSPGNISWHLSILAKYGYIEEVEVPGRRRPWRLVSLGMEFSTGEENSPDLAAAEDALEATIAEMTFARRREWQGLRQLFDARWRRAAFTTSALVYLTPDELDALAGEINLLIHRFKDRSMDRSLRPADAHPVQLVAWGHPLPPTKSGS